MSCLQKCGRPVYRLAPRFLYQPLQPFQHNSFSLSSLPGPLLRGHLCPNFIPESPSSSSPVSRRFSSSNSSQQSPSSSNSSRESPPPSSSSSRCFPSSNSSKKSPSSSSSRCFSFSSSSKESRLSYSRCFFSSNSSEAETSGEIKIDSSEAATSGKRDIDSSEAATSGRIKIYTKTGDKGESSLYDGQRRRKDDPTFEALGDVDELNSALGLAHEHCAQVKHLTVTKQQIEEIQSRLLDVGSAVATPLNSLSAKKVARVRFNVATVGVLEKWIDEMDEELPQLTSFILPSGGLPAASLHVARSICRRAERKVVALVEMEVVDRSVAQYLNRLSDYLFTAARYSAMKLEKPETVWVINKR